MDRNFFHARSVTLLAGVLAFVVLNTGCGVLQFAMYVVNGTDVKAEYNDLKGKKVAVICHTGSRFHPNSEIASRALALEIGRLLRQHISKIEVVRQQEIDKWIDEHGPEKLEQIQLIGQDLSVDRVIDIDFDGYEVEVHSTLLQGQADLRISVYDIENDESGEGMLVWEKELLNSEFPSNPVPSSEHEKEDFERLFIKVLAARVGQLFYPHDGYATFGEDATVFSAGK